MNKLFNNEQINHIACFIRNAVNSMNISNEEYFSIKGDVMGKTFESSLDKMCGMENIDMGLADNICNDTLISAKATKALTIYSTDKQSSSLMESNINPVLHDRFIGVANNELSTFVIERRLSDETIIGDMNNNPITAIEKINKEILAYKNKTIREVETKLNTKINDFKSVSLYFSDIYKNKMKIIISVDNYNIYDNIEKYRYISFNASSKVLTKYYDIITNETYFREIDLTPPTKDDIININSKYIR